MGIAMQAIAGIDDADLVEPVDAFIIDAVAGHIGPVEADGFGDLRADGEDGIQGGHRVLEDVGDLFAPHVAQVMVG